MKINKLITICLAASLLCACGNGDDPSSSTSADPSSTDTSSSSSSQSSSSSSSESTFDSSSTSEPINYETVTISQANTYCDSIVEAADAVNTTGDKKVSITGRMMFAETNNCTKAGYLSTNLYKLFVFDGTGYIYVGVDTNRYNTVFSKYEYSDTSYYTFKGTINKYLGSNEIIMDSYTWLSSYSGPTFDYSTLESLYPTRSTMSEIYNLNAAQKLNVKGNKLGEVVSFVGKYIDKVEASIALFADGKNVMRVHGDGKLNNQFFKSNDRTPEAIDSGKTYVIYCTLNMFDYVPEVQFLAAKEYDGEPVVTYSTEGVTTLTANNVWSIIPNKDNLKNDHYVAYESMAQEIHYFEGYITYSNISNKLNMLLSDTAKTDGYNSAANEKAGKALRINNIGETALSSDIDIDNSTFAAVFTSKATAKIGIYFTTKSYNTNGYWQIQVLNRFDIKTIA